MGRPPLLHICAIGLVAATSLSAACERVVVVPDAAPRDAAAPTWDAGLTEGGEDCLTATPLGRTESGGYQAELEISEASADVPWPVAAAAEWRGRDTGPRPDRVWFLRAERSGWFNGYVETKGLGRSATVLAFASSACDTASLVGYGFSSEAVSYGRSFYGSRPVAKRAPEVGRFDFAVAAGTTYYIVLAGLGSDEGCASFSGRIWDDREGYSDQDDSLLHCGASGAGCGPSANCRSGACECAPEAATCGNDCARRTDRQHCGSCDNDCGDGLCLFEWGATSTCVASGTTFADAVEIAQPSHEGHYFELSGAPTTPTLPCVGDHPRRVFTFVTVGDYYGHPEPPVVGPSGVSVGSPPYESRFGNDGTGANIAVFRDTGGTPELIACEAYSDSGEGFFSVRAGWDVTLGERYYVVVWSSTDYAMDVDAQLQFWG